MLERIQETAAFLRSKMHTQPETAIILGTGLGSLANEITDKYEIGYETIPNFPVSTVEGHSGKLIFGKLGNKDIMAMQGRFHFYEGYAMTEVTFPIRVMRELGIRTLFVSNAAGGMNPDFEIGDLMIITDHINFFPEHPLRGRNIPYGPRFPDMSEAYSRNLIAQAKEIAAEKGIRVYSPAEFNDCEFNNRVVLAGSNGLSITFNSRTMNNGVDVTEDIIKGGNVPVVTIK